MRKYAGIDNDNVASSVVGPLYTVGTLGIAPLTGTITGLSRKPMTDPEEQEDSSGLSWLPGVANDRRLRRRTGLSARHGAGKGKTLSETFGTATSTAAATLLGAGIGAGISATIRETSMPFNVGKGAFVGGTAALTAALLLGLAGKAQRGRSAAEQAAYERSRGQTLANWLVPGAAAYNKTLSYKRVHDDEVLSQVANE